MKLIAKVAMLATIVGLAMVPALSEARGFGGGGHSFGGGGHSFGGGGGFHGSYSAPRSSGFGYSRSSYSAPASGSGFGYARTNAAARPVVNQTVVNHTYVGGRSSGGFWSGYMWGSMMSHPYYGGYGYGGYYAPPGYVGYTGGYGMDGYYAGGGFIPYSPVGYVFACFMTLVMVFLITWFLAAIVCAVLSGDWINDDDY